MLVRKRGASSETIKRQCNNTADSRQLDMLGRVVKYIY